MAVYSRIAGTGSYLPERVLTNADLEKMVETNDEWIVSRSGIRERHIAAEGETTSDLAFHAAKRALEAAGLDAADIELIVLGTTTPDVIFPSTACLVQDRLGANGCAAFDVNLLSIPARTSCQHCLGETLMSWKTPKIVEVPVGMEINMYACAARK